MSDTPTPFDVIFGELVAWPIPGAQVTDDVLDALAAAGYRVVPVPDEDTRRRIEQAVDWLRDRTYEPSMGNREHLARWLARYVLGRDA